VKLKAFPFLLESDLVLVQAFVLVRFLPSGMGQAYQMAVMGHASSRMMMTVLMYRLNESRMD
jgi:hypothetical protein